MLADKIVLCHEDASSDIHQPAPPTARQCSSMVILVLSTHDRAANNPTATSCIGIRLCRGHDYWRCQALNYIWALSVRSTLIQQAKSRWHLRQESGN